MTSLLGIEALIRGKAVTCLGLSFYSGWGLTQDQREVPGRQARPDILPLIHIYILINTSIYLYLLIKLPCPPEVAVEQLAEAIDHPQAWYLRPLVKV